MYKTHRYNSTTGVGSRINEGVDLTRIEKPLDSYLNHSNVNSLFMYEVSNSEVEKLLIRVIENKAMGHDYIDPRLRKLCQSHIIPLLT